MLFLFTGNRFCSKLVMMMVSRIVECMLYRNKDQFRLISGKQRSCFIGLFQS